MADLFENYLAALVGQAPASSAPAHVPSPAPGGDDPYQGYLQTLAGQAPAPQPVPHAGKDAPPQSGPGVPGRGGAEYDLAIEGGQLVLPGTGVIPGSLYVRDGKIAALSTTGGHRAAQTLDATGKHVLPGIIDPHTHLGIYEPFEAQLASETRAALAGGVTTAGLFAATPDASPEHFHTLRRQVAARSHINILPHCILNDRAQLAQLPGLVHGLGIRSFKVYLHGVPGLIPSSDDAFVVEVMQALKQTGQPCVLCVHSENHALVARATQLGQAAAPTGASLDNWDATHPALAEEEAILRIAFYAKKFRQMVYIVHVSSAEGAEAVRRVKRDNPYLRAETTSPYLAAPAEGRGDLLLKMEPPVRGGPHQEALWQALADGTLDTVGTDNVPLPRAMKAASTNLWEVPSGYSVIETHLCATLTRGAVQRQMDLERLVAALTLNPAKIFGLYPRKGSLLPGADADITVVDMARYKTVEAAKLLSPSGFSYLEGSSLTGWPVATVLGGRLAARDGRIIEDPGGRMLP